MVLTERKYHCWSNILHHRLNHPSCVSFQDMIWDKTGLSNAVDGPVNITSLYYTCALMPPVEVSSVPAGSKLSSLSQIPGWLISNDNACQQPVTDQQEQVSEVRKEGNVN